MTFSEPTKPIGLQYVHHQPPLKSKLPLLLKQPAPYKLIDIVETVGRNGKPRYTRIERERLEYNFNDYRFEREMPSLENEYYYYNPG